MSDYKKRIEEIVARGHLNLTEDDIAILEPASHKDAKSAKILGAFSFNSGAYEDAVTYSRRAYKIAPEAESADNLISCLSRAKHFEEAIEIALDPKTPLSDLRRASHLSERYVAIKDTENAVLWGKRALEIKEAQAPVLKKRPKPIVHAFDPETPSRNVISFSLWGDHPRYVEGARRNAMVIPYVFPGWTARFYVDDSVPQEALRELHAHGAELRMMPSMPAGRFGLFWRFLVEDDVDVDLYLVRDADSVVTTRDANAVWQWLESGQPFHLYRDHIAHSELVLAGLWGAHRGNITQMTDKIRAFNERGAHVLNSRIGDQVFLRDVIWSHMRDRCAVFDPAFEFGATAQHMPDIPQPAKRHMGQDDTFRRFDVARTARTKQKG